MSVATEVSRIQGLRDDLRTKLVGMGLAESSDKLEDCVGAVAGTIDGMTGTSYTVPAGYHSGTGTVTLTDSIEQALAAI